MGLREPPPGMVRPRPLNKRAKNLRLQLRGQLKSLHEQAFAIKQSIKAKQAVIEWLESPWDYGDIVESIPVITTRQPKQFVIVAVSSLGVWGREINDFGKLKLTEESLMGRFKDEPIGRYTGEDLPRAPQPAVEAMKARGSWTSA